MKTLEEMQNGVKDVWNAFVVVRDSADKKTATKKAEAKQSELFASLAAWDAVVREALPGLQAELEGLKALRDGQTEAERVEASKSLPRGKALVSWLYQEGSEPFIALDARILTSGLARLEYLRGILGEKAP